MTFMLFDFATSYLWQLAVGLMLLMAKDEFDRRDG
jgi:hypothetical protein